MGESTMVNVQEMVRKDPENIPQKYMRNEKDITGEIILCGSTGEIPILDLGLLESGHVAELVRLDMACACWGFFLVVNHGIGEKVSQDMKRATNDFFGLPIEEKTKCKLYGQAVTYSEEQTMDWSDSIMLSITPLQNRKIELWPSKPTEFRDAAEVYATEVKRVAHKLLNSLSLVMGMDKKNSLLELHNNELSQAMRVNYCPPCSRPDQIWSNGKYESVEHRVVPNHLKARVSFATFFFPGLDVEVEPLDQMLNTGKNDKRYKKINTGEYFKHALAKKMEGKSHTAFVKYDNKGEV